MLAEILDGFACLLQHVLLPKLSFTYGATETFDNSGYHYDAKRCLFDLEAWISQCFNLSV